MRPIHIIAAVAVALAARPAAACRGCKAPTLTELAQQASAIVAGKVQSADKHEHSVIAVADVWKGTASKTVERTGCWQLFEHVGAKVIVMRFPAGWKTAWISGCIGVYPDTPANRTTLTKLFGAPQAP